MAKSSKQEKRLSDQKNSSGDTLDDRNDIFRSEGLFELAEKLQYLEKEHLQQVKDIDSRYQDVFDGKPYFMYAKRNKAEIALLREIIRTLQKINDILEDTEKKDGSKVR